MGGSFFTTAYFHLPAELEGEIDAAGLRHERTVGIEGPGWLLQDLEARWSDERWVRRLVEIARRLESEPSLLGVSAHLLAIADRP